MLPLIAQPLRLTDKIAWKCSHKVNSKPLGNRIFELPFSIDNICCCKKVVIIEKLVSSVGQMFKIKAEEKIQYRDITVRH